MRPEVRQARPLRPASKIADAVAAHMPQDPAIAKVEVAGPGFINFYLTAAANNAVLWQRPAPRAWTSLSPTSAAASRPRSSSSPPTPSAPCTSATAAGPRWATRSAASWSHAGYDIQREFYINDHGSQMDAFGNSITYALYAAGRHHRQAGPGHRRRARAADRQGPRRLRCRTRPTSIPRQPPLPWTPSPRPWARQRLRRRPTSSTRPPPSGSTDGDKWAHADRLRSACASFRERGLRQDGRQHAPPLPRRPLRLRSSWYSERTALRQGHRGPQTAGTSAVDRAFAKLDEMGYLYTKDGALWFRSTDLGDDKDRVLIKADGEYTYFASDVAYHWDKFQRVDHVIDIWGCRPPRLHRARPLRLRRSWLPRQV